MGAQLSVAVASGVIVVAVMATVTVRRREQAKPAVTASLVGKVKKCVPRIVTAAFTLFTTSVLLIVMLIARTRRLRQAKSVILFVVCSATKQATIYAQPLEKCIIIISPLNVLTLPVSLTTAKSWVTSPFAPCVARLTILRELHRILHAARCLLVII